MTTELVVDHVTLVVDPLCPLLIVITRLKISTSHFFKPLFPSLRPKTAEHRLKVQIVKIRELRGLKFLEKGKMLTFKLVLS